MTDDMDAIASPTIPVCEVYRGVGIHVFQSKERISKVKSAIDEVYAIGDLQQLYKYACKSRNPPEARLFAGAKCEAIWEAAVENREARPDLDLDVLRGVVGILNSLNWISRLEYGSLLDRDGEPRERVLTDSEMETAGRRKK